MLLVSPLLPGESVLPGGAVLHLFPAPAEAAAQSLDAGTGVTAAGLLLRQLDGEKRVLMIAAHPDDEDTALLAALARSAGAQTAYLSLNRGEGGQNVIGPELDEGLGIIRTGELLAARRLDGAEQYFTRSYDFGFSRSAEESFQHWDREELLDDVVRVVRRFRPQVIVSIFEGSPRDGHGQHQVAGILAREAFQVAGDPDRFPHHAADGLEPWVPLKLYRSTRFRPDEATLTVETGHLDPLLGRSVFQLAMEGRSLHRSQEMGAPQHAGPRTAPLILEESRVPGHASAPAPEDGIFAGIDTALVGMDRYRSALREAEAALSPSDPGAIVEPLGRALAELRAADARASLQRREALVQQAILAGAGVVVDARTDRDRAVPGGSVEVEVRVWNGGTGHLEGVEPHVEVPAAWRVEALPPEAWADAAGGFFFGQVGGQAAVGPAAVPSNELMRWRFRVEVPEAARLTREYYLEEPRDGGLYRWPAAPELKGLPGTPAPIQARVEMGLGSGPEPLRLTAHPRVQHVAVDRIMGEYREPFLVVPRLAVEVDPGWLAWPTDRREARTVTLRLRSETPEPTRGTARLHAPEGWRVEPAALPFEVEGMGRELELAFQLSPVHDPEPGRIQLRAEVTDEGGRPYEEGFGIIDYPHIDRVPLYRPARVEMTVLPVQVAEGLRVGYVMGSGDDGAEALRQMGAQVELLGPEELRSGDLDRFHTIVLGVRAYEVRPDLEARNDRILDFARRGGTVVVQYHKYEYPGGDFAPYHVAMARPHDRITDPDAPVTLLDPESPLFRAPNRIRDSDFQGWVQERGLYFLSEWDEAFTPLLEMADPGLDPVRGSLVVAPLGEGLYIYTGLALFRQLPAGVPGAFRLLANMVSLDAGSWAAHHGPRVDEREPSPLQPEPLP
jgi:LmbE family N-acetylglucosaminyl deacetylase